MNPYLLSMRDLFEESTNPKVNLQYLGFLIVYELKKILQYNIVRLLLYCMSKRAVLCKIVIYVLNRRLYNMFVTADFDLN